MAHGERHPNQRAPSYDDAILRQQRQRAADLHYTTAKEVGSRTYAGASVPDQNLSFPSGIGTGEGDLWNWMLFTSKEIVGGFEGTKNVKFGDPSGSVALPIPPGIQATYEQNWSQENVGTGIQAVAQLANTETGRNMVNSIRGFLGAMDVNTSGNPGIFQQPDPASDALALGLKSAPGIGVPLQTTLGIRALDQIMMSYGGPAFRNFNYSYSLKPNNPEDSHKIEQIVKWFKFKSAPRQGGSRFTRLYKLPHVFQIQFYSGPSATENENLPRVGHCALTNITAQYGGDIFRTFEGTDAPVQINLTLAFKEMELLSEDNFIDKDY